MGLDARVYTNARRLLSAVDLAQTTIGSYTGEATPDSDGRFIAIEKRLGNASMIVWLSEQVASALTNIPASVILTKVLYSATHSGDVIGAPDLPQLQREIEMVRKEYKGRPAVAIQRFLNDFEELIAAPREQGNPIVFV
jgi:hypothetical protein